MPRLALYQPDIPQNTGTLLRLAACLGVAVDIIEPAGFDVSDRNFRRAGLDYLDQVEIARHRSWRAFEEWRTEQGRRLVLATTKGALPYTDYTFLGDDILLLGRESAGVPDEVHEAADARVVVPMRPGLRSLNVAVAGAMILGEALRQTHGFISPLVGEVERTEGAPDEGGSQTFAEKSALPPPPGRRCRGDSTSPIEGEGKRCDP
ncbi:MAG: tRNA (cytidine/uridine-2-O-)-methyltransferase [Sphingomonadales bacterium]|nr:tRNA (cytidine/uridine-2-O-)-methyltransferase [Sphingomonadales bacterium]